MMTEEEILRLITNEFQNKTLGITEQYLDIHQPVYNNSILKIARIDREDLDGTVVAYLPVENEHFWFAVYVDPEKKEITAIDTESENIVSLMVESDDLTVAELQAFVKLKPTESHSKGDLWDNKKSKYNYSRLTFTPNPEPDCFNDKLNKLLAYLEQDRQGILLLGTKADAFVHVVMKFHYGNQLIGAASIDMSNITRLSNLGLKINFHFSAWGNPYK